MTLEYHQIGDPFEPTNRPLVFEINLKKRLTNIQPSTYGLVNVESLDPNDYFITSGDAYRKAKQFYKDLVLLTTKLSDKQDQSEEYKSYIKALDTCKDDAIKLVQDLALARGDDVFLETEFSVNRRLLCVRKNPRIKK